MKTEAGTILLPYEVTAHNYGAAHANKIHSDAGAAEHGFAGALVPGVAMYAYLTRPVVEALGRDWLERGTMSAKFIHPVYNGERVRTEARTAVGDARRIELQLFNSAGAICAVGNAALPDDLSAIASKGFPSAPLPDESDRWPATIGTIYKGAVFGSLNFTLDLAAGMGQFLDDMVDDMSIYRGEAALCHPAFWIAQANEIFMRNIALGMWIHTASETQHYALARHGEPISLRGRVIEAFEKRGHELITADLGIFGKEDRAIARIKHTAIIRLKP